MEEGNETTITENPLPWVMNNGYFGFKKVAYKISTWIQHTIDDSIPTPGDQKNKEIEVYEFKNYLFKDQPRLLKLIDRLSPGSVPEFNQSKLKSKEIVGIYMQFMVNTAHMPRELFFDAAKFNKGLGKDNELLATLVWLALNCQSRFDKPGLTEEEMIQCVPPKTDRGKAHEAAEDAKGCLACCACCIDCVECCV